MGIQIHLLLVAICALPLAQGSNSDVHVTFIDDQTGFAIAPQNVHSNAALTAEPDRGPGAVRISPDFRGRLLRVEAAGYRPVSFAVGNEEAIRLFLSPLAPPLQFSAEALEMLEGSKRITIVGFVSDGEKGTALPSVREFSPELGKSIETNRQVFFTLAAPEPKHYSTETASLVILRFEKNGYVTMVREKVRVASGSVRKYRIRLQPGQGSQTVLERFRSTESQESSPREEAGESKVPAAVQSAPVLPPSIRVGRNCKDSTSCTSVDVATLENYTKHVLPNEWLASWHKESLRAGSVAIRSVGVWYTNHPKTSKYDVCDSTACQVYDPDVSEATTDAATDATASNVLVEKGTNRVAKAEFAAENNNAGCGDGKSGTKTTWPCIDDSVCTGQPKNGHGRGMCQRGSNRWANGKNASGTPAKGGNQNMDWMLTHYYPDFEKTQGSTATVVP
jgi:hypothetical protein